MTGFLNNGSNPLSAITAASLKDMNYTVNAAASDDFIVPAKAVVAKKVSVIELLEQVFVEPLFEVDENGQVRPVRRRR